MTKIKGFLSESGLIARLLILIGFSFFFMALGMTIWTAFTHGDIGTIQNLKSLQLIQSISFFVLPPVALAYLCSSNTLHFLHLDRKVNWTDTLFVVVFMIVVIPFINLLGDLNHQLVLPKMFAGLETMMKASEDQAMRLTERFLTAHTASTLLFNIFLIALLPAFGEELFFRSALQGIFSRRMNVKLAIWIVAIIFSAIHFQFYGFVPRMLLGAFFGYMLYWSGNIWLPVIAHFINNVLAVIFFYLKTNGYKVIDLDSIGVGNTLWVGVLSGILTVVGFFLFQRYFQRKKTLLLNAGVNQEQ